MSDRIAYHWKEEPSLAKLVSRDAFREASAEELRVLLVLLAEGCTVETKTLTLLSGCAEESLADALAYWRGAGILKKGKAKQAETQEQEKSASEPLPDAAPKKKPLPTEDRLYSHTASELAAQITDHALAEFLDVCQRTAGKIFNPVEINIIVGLHTQLGLSEEYILLLIAYCFSNGKRSLKYAERVAFTLQEKGILTPEDLELYIAEREKFASFEWQLKKKVGMGERDFSKTQRALVDRWELTYRYDMDIVGLAYDRMIDAVGKVNFSYMEKMLSAWHAKGLRTVAEVEAHLAEEKETRAQSAAKKEGARTSQVSSSSFDTDDFFARALARSYGKPETK